jgi:acyl-CoA thioester hydrolase
MFIVQKISNFVISKRIIMYISETRIRTRYGETDQMGYIYYGNYAQYFEVARVEAMRDLGMSYRELELKGIMLPVVSFNINFLKPAHYDENLNIITKIIEMPTVRIKFDYETYNENGDLLNTAATTLFFFNKEKNKPCHPPSDFLELFKGYF